MMARRVRWGLLSCGFLWLSCGTQETGEQAPVLAGPLSLRCALPAGTSLPELTTSPNGPALLFTAEEGDTTRLQWMHWGGDQWTDTTTIAQGTTMLVNWADRPGLAFGMEGDAHAHWLEVDPRGDFTYGIRTVHSSDGGLTWSPPDCPHRDTAVAEHGFGQWMTGVDGVLFAWLDGRQFDGHSDPAKAPMEVRAAQWTAAQGWSDEVVLDSSACTCCPLTAAPQERGHLLAYRDRTSDEVRDFSGVVIQAAEDGGPAVVEGPSPVGHDGWRIAGCPVNGAALASSSERTLAVWFTNAGDTARVRSSWKSGKGDWSPAVNLNSGEAVGRVAAAVDGGGRFHAVWMERRAGEAVLVGCHWDALGQPLDDRPAVLTGVDAARAGGFPSVVGLDEGGVMLAWTTTGKEAHVRTAQWTPSP